MLEQLNRIVVVTGHYGSGKTNLSVNLAMSLRAAGEEVTLVDLDIVNPYFRSADFETLAEENGWLTITVADDGRGMSPEFLATVTDPFTTTRTTRKVGLGLPLLRLAAEQTGGQMKVDSRLGEGTTVTAAFDTASIDCPPLGDMPGTVSLLVQGAPEGLEITYTRSTPKGGFRFDTRQVREILGPDVPLSSPDVAMWVRDFVAENEAEIT